MVKNLPEMQETQVQSPCREKSPGEGSGNPFQYSCLKKRKKSHGQKSLVGRSSWGRKELEVTE